ncbi:MAG: DAK2 domain-containing protein [Mycoplasmataceae bacterium]|jgi:DAK2 domain fusion protein YloV|nr:DAK2 domain-containing protein [Mycoplasmataceae bacterium]
MITIDSNKLKEMFISGAEAVSNEYEYINELNVFPVPDGDTGSNMMITINGACDAIKNVDFTDISQLGKTFSRGLLMNARGNSGVIFSQIIKGFTSVLKEGANDIGLIDFINAFTNAKNIAYAAVASPVEGTILTVIRVTSEQLNKKKNTFRSVEQVMQAACDEASKILERTPDFLQELKEVGVVDSGGYGLCRFFDGMNLALKGQKSSTNIKNQQNLSQIKAKKSFLEGIDDNNEGFGYCCEFIMKLQSRVSLQQKLKEKFDKNNLKRDLEKIGNSLAMVVDEDLVKVHVHSLTPYRVLEIGARYGEFSKVKIENMTLQFLERNPGTTLETMNEDISSKKNKKQLPSQVKVIATVASSELVKIYKTELGIEQTINTAITGNPSIQEILTKIREANSSNIIIVVDDGNIVLAAKEAIQLTRNVHIELINAKDSIASYLTCLAYDPVKNIEDNMESMNDTLDELSSGSVSKSIKVVKYSHINVNKGDYIGIIDKRIMSSSRNLLNVSINVCDELIDNVRKAKNLYVMYGKGTEIRDIRNIKKYIVEKYRMNVQLIPAKQQTYYFYFAVTR